MMIYNPYLGIKYNKNKIVFENKNSFTALWKTLLYDWDNLSDEAKETIIKLLEKISSY